MSVALAAVRPAALDRLRAPGLPLATQAAAVVGAALLTAVLAQFELKLYLWEVPLTLQTVAVYGTGLVLGRRNGALAMGLYLLLGLVLPVYSGGDSGAAHLFGATGGYLLAFPLVALVAGAVTETSRTLGRSALALLAGSAVLFTCGVVVLHAVAGHASWETSVVNGWLRFVPWDLAKIAAVSGTYAALRRVGA
ncbi:MAG TPA: biotin transporter BioY [Rubricoccaceae bacterium]|jgi:biotin transport system substrate-specific component